MKLFENCLLASDIDETLLSDGHLPTRNIERIRFFVEQGGKFSVATGRSVGAVNMVFRAIPELAPSVIANGCMIYDFQHKQIMHSNIVPPEDRWIVQRMLELKREIGVDVQCGDRMTVLHETQETIDNRDYEQMTVQNVTLADIRDEDWTKVIFMFANDEDYAVVKEIIGRQPMGCDFFDTTALIYGRKRRYYEQVPHGVSKACTLRRLCDMLGIAPGCYFAIGDYYNDLEMIIDADISAATAGAPEDIRQRTDFVAGPAANGAVADFIDYLTKLRKDA